MTYKAKPENTAIRRSKASKPARLALKHVIQETDPRVSVLDYGCGWGIDVSFFNQEGVPATGWDPAPKFGHSKKPRRKFALVTVTYVLNVLPTIDERIGVLQNAAEYMYQRGGQMLVATRSSKAVERAARRGNWRVAAGGGYWSNLERRMFQIGINYEQIRYYAKQAGLVCSRIEVFDNDTTYALITRPRT